MIDIHTHVFNLRYLPIEGIMTQRFGAPEALASVVGWVLRRSTEDGRRLESRTVPPELLVPAIVSQLDDEDLDDAELRRALDQLDLPDDGSPELEGLGSWVRRRIEKAWEAFLDTLENAEAVAKWFSLLREDERDIYGHMDETYTKAELFVHHMMDMDEHYEMRSPEYSLSEQIRRMRGLAKEADGKLLTFVAFDPFREDSFKIVKAALEDGACGVKFYPPNGYKPVDNATAELPPHISPASVDQANRELFEYCVEAGVPIFTHCTSSGFESKKGYGKYADPKNWRKVLETPGLSDLRLCLGHAGGAKEWTEPGGIGPGSYASEVVKLCREFPNVYAEFGHFEEVLAGGHDAALTENLANVFAAPPGPHSFADKVMYGTDWHVMAVTVAEPHGYHERFEQIFEDPRLSANATNFFRDNAVRYLNISGFLARNQGRLTAKEESYLQQFVTT